MAEILEYRAPKVGGRWGRWNWWRLWWFPSAMLALLGRLMDPYLLGIPKTDDWFDFLDRNWGRVVNYSLASLPILAVIVLALKVFKTPRRKSQSGHDSKNEQGRG